MTDQPSVTQLPLFPDSLLPPKTPQNQPKWHSYWQQAHALPSWVSESASVQRYLDLLGPLHWADYPERNLQRNWGQAATPFATLAAAELIKLEEGLGSAKKLRAMIFVSATWL